MLSQASLKKILFYDFKTGRFIWKVNRKGVKKGTTAGYVCAHGYRKIMIERKKYKASRLAFLYMTGKFPRKEVDHRNRIKEDDAWDNLRDVSHSINGRNISLRIDNSSGTTGVSWSKYFKKWHTRITIENRHIFLGYFKDKSEAIQVRKEAEKEYGYL